MNYEDSRAQTFWHALSVVERERDEARAESARLSARVAELEAFRAQIAGMELYNPEFDDPEAIIDGLIEKARALAAKGGADE